MKNIKITIIGNSVAIRNRPPQKYPHNKNYGIILEELFQYKYPKQFVSVNNMGFSRATIVNVLERTDEYIASMPHYYIINIGVSDASTREIPYWMAEIINNPKKSWYKSLFSGIHHHFIKPKRSFFVKLRGKRSWVTKKEFKKCYRTLIQLLQKETNARIITVPINPANERVEMAVPGSNKNYQEYSRIIKSIAKTNDCFYLDLDDLNSEQHYPDGIHYSYKGNELVAKKLFGVIEKDINNAK